MVSEALVVGKYIISYSFCLVMFSTILLKSDSVKLFCSADSLAHTDKEKLRQSFD